MMRSVLLAVTVTLVLPGMSYGWTRFEETDAMGTYVAVYQADATDAFEVEFFCDEVFPDDIAVTVLTPDTFGKVKSSSTTLTLAFGGRTERFPAEIVDIDGQFAVQAWESDSPDVRQLVNDIMGGTGMITASWESTSVTFASEDAASVLGGFLEFCAIE